MFHLITTQQHDIKIQAAKKNSSSITLWLSVQKGKQQNFSMEWGEVSTPKVIEDKLEMFDCEISEGKGFLKEMLE